MSVNKFSRSYWQRINSNSSISKQFQIGTRRKMCKFRVGLKKDSVIEIDSSNSEVTVDIKIIVNENNNNNDNYYSHNTTINETM